MNELQEKIETELVTKTFNISYVPESIWQEMDEFCKEFYGNSRWRMVYDLIQRSKDDFKFQAIWDKIQTLEEDVHGLLQKQEEWKTRKVKTFGGGLK